MRTWFVKINNCSDLSLPLYYFKGSFLVLIKGFKYLQKKKLLSAVL